MRKTLGTFVSVQFLMIISANLKYNIPAKNCLPVKLQLHYKECTRLKMRVNKVGLRHSLSRISFCRLSLQCLNYKNLKPSLFLIARRRQNRRRTRLVYFILQPQFNWGQCLLLSACLCTRTKL